MNAIHTVQTAHNGLINIQLPEKYWGKEVEIIVLPVQHKNTTQKKSLRGCLSQYANPTLTDSENNAWLTVMEEKHGNS